MAEIKNVTCFLYENQAEEAAKFYVSVFPGAKMGRVTYYTEGMPMPKGTVLTAEFSMLGRDFFALNYGQDPKYSDAISIQILCDTQEELDSYWDKLLAGGGQEVACGWLKDKYGMRWQITPKVMNEFLSSADKEARDRAIKAMMGMVKLDIAALEKAYKG